MTFNDGLTKLVGCVHTVARHKHEDPREFSQQVASALREIAVQGEEGLVDVIGYDDVALVSDLMWYRPRAELMTALETLCPVQLQTSLRFQPTEKEMTWDELRKLNRECFDRAAAAEQRTESRREKRGRKKREEQVHVAEERPLNAQLYDAAERGSLLAVRQIGRRLLDGNGLGRPCAELKAGGIGPDGWTGLMRAALFGFTPVVRELLTLGADASKQNLYGQTAAELAILNGHRQCADVLVGRAVANNREILRLHDFGAARAVLRRRWDEFVDMDLIRELVEHDALRRAELESSLEAAEAQVENLAEANAVLESRAESADANLEVIKLRRRIHQLERARSSDVCLAKVNEDLQAQVWKEQKRADLQKERADCLEGRVFVLETTAVPLESERRQERAQAARAVKELRDQVQEQEERIGALTAELELKATCDVSQDDSSTSSLDRAVVFIGDVDDQAVSETDDWFFADTPTIA